MVDQQLEKALLAAEVPERLYRFWEDFPTRVLRRLYSNPKGSRLGMEAGGGLANYLQRFGGIALIVCSLAIIFTFLHLGSALRLGDDEGYEVIKALMCSKGFHLYTDIWNDQPPISTFLLSAAFKLFGPSILTARLVAAAFGLFLAICFHELVRQKSGYRTALFATLFLVAAPGSLVVMVSVMLECPAFATALLSCWLAFRWAKCEKLPWLAASGTVMAIALQIKLTAALVVPALALELLLVLRTRQKSLTQMLRPGLLWSVAFLAVFLLIAFILGKGSLASSWQSHTEARAVPGLDMPADHTFNFRLLKSNIECAAGALLCVLLAVWRKRLRELAFPMALLATVALVHAFHRPWWDYYYLHFTIPLAWLTGWTVNALIVDVYRLQTIKKVAGLKTVSIVTLCGLVAFAFAKSERRLEGSIKLLRAKQAANSNPIVQVMKRQTTGTPWVYAEDGIYPFHAGLRVIPELAIVMPKRFWSGQITTSRIIETCRKYKPQFIVIRSDSFNPEWRNYLGADYRFGAIDNVCQLYIRK